MENRKKTAFIPAQCEGIPKNPNVSHGKEKRKMPPMRVGVSKENVLSLRVVLNWIEVFTL